MYFIIQIKIIDAVIVHHQFSEPRNGYTRLMCMHVVCVASQLAFLPLCVEIVDKGKQTRIKIPCTLKLSYNTMIYSLSAPSAQCSNSGKVTPIAQFQSAVTDQTHKPSFLLGKEQMNFCSRPKRKGSPTVCKIGNIGVVTCYVVFLVSHFTLCLIYIVHDSMPKGERLYTIVNNNRPLTRNHQLQIWLQPMISLLPSEHLPLLVQSGLMI